MSLDVNFRSWGYGCKRGGTAKGDLGDDCGGVEEGDERG